MALGRLICDLRTCSAGVVAVVTAMVLPLLLGFTSLGVEVGHWYLAQRQMQGAADAAAISAVAQYIADYPANSTTYQAVGVNYASLNGFTIPTQNVCLIDAGGVSPGCNVLAIDSRAFPAGCSASTRVCVVVEITQNTFSWASTRSSLEPTGSVGRVQAIPTPTLKARAIVSVTIQSNTSPPTKGGDCILAMANDPGAVTIHGTPANLQAACGIAIDGGIDQNVNGTPKGGITFSGNPTIHIGCNAISNPTCPVLTPTPLVVAASSTGCPSSHCFWFNPSGTALPSSAVKTGTATPDPYASRITTLFQTAPPLGVQSNLTNCATTITCGVAIAVQGSKYTAGTCTFTVNGGTGTPAKFTATIPANGATKGQVTAIVVSDPGAYTIFPTNPVTATTTCSNAQTITATFKLTEGCFTWISGMTPIAGRKYCSINLQGAGTTNFPAGNYYIAGGDVGAPNTGCVGFCVSSANATVTSDVAGVTFYLMKGDGANTRGSSVYAQVSISSGNVSLCAPGTTVTGTTCNATNYGTTCTNATSTSCMLFIQDPVATPSVTIGSPATTDNTFSGNGTRVLSGLLYLPQQTFDESGNGPINGCFGLIAKYVDVGGTPTFANGCLPGNGIGGTPGKTTSSLTNPRLYQ
jgi:Flp pilus assembly protein TadG